MAASTLSVRLGRGERECQSIMTSFLDRYASLRSYLHQVVHECRAKVSVDVTL